MAGRFDELVRLMAKLRAPDGCPWDRKQTHESLKPYLLEETYEVLETIDKQDEGKLREELGDLLLQILFHAQIAAERKAFSVEDVMQLLADKLVRRHPHVFGPKGDGALTPDQVYSNWEQIKKSERQQTGRSESVLDGVPNTLPALLRAFQIQARASRAGWEEFIFLIGFISVAIGFFNLLPLPLLDGGHAAFYWWEGLRGKRASNSAMEKANTLGIAFLMSLLVFATYNDVLRIRTERASKKPAVETKK